MLSISSLKSSYFLLCVLCVLCGKALSQWDKYPTYDEHLSMMSKFETDYPELCKIVELGESVQGRKLLAAKVSDNVNEEEKEPAFLYHATIHGDETLGYVLMLRLINYLLSNYENDALVTKIVDSVEIWIAPLVNPDGTYRDGDTIIHPRRYNANNRDLNRNWPYIDSQGVHEYGLYNSWELEVKALKEFFESDNFVMSAAIHGGMEAVIYPASKYQTVMPDAAWWRYVCTMYSDTAGKYSPSGYLSEVLPDSSSVSSIGAWLYYTILFQHCRDVTLELSIQKFLSESRLEDHWEWNYRSLLNYIQQVLYGIRGTVTDTTTGHPIGQVKVFIEDHDTDSSFVRSHLPHGDYYRPIYAGTYDVTFSCPGYHSKTFTGIQVENNKATILDVQLSDGPIDIISKPNTISGISIDIRKGFILIKSDFPLNNNMKVEIYDLMGRRVKTIPACEKIPWEEGNGMYIVRLVGKDINRQFKVMVNK